MPGKRPAIRSRRCTRSSSSCCSRSRRSSRRRCRRWPGRCGRRAWRPSAEAAGAVRGHGPSLLRDYLTATPAVAGYVADEVERRAAEGTRFDGQLAVLQGIAKTGPERAAVTLLAARAAEGSGGSVTAERLAHEASG